MKSAVEWKFNAMGDENSVGDQIDLSFDSCEGVESIRERVMA